MRKRISGKRIAGKLRGEAHVIIFTGILIITLIFVFGTFAGLAAYAIKSPSLRVFSDPEFIFAVLFTLKTTMLATACASFVALAIAYILSYHSFPGKKVIGTLLRASDDGSSSCEWGLRFSSFSVRC